MALFGKKKQGAPAPQAESRTPAEPARAAPVVDGMQAALAHRPTPAPGYQRLLWSPLADGIAGVTPGTDFIYSEAIRPLSGDDEYADAQRVNEQLRSATGRGLQQALVDNQGRAFTTEQYNAKAGWIDPVSGVIAAAAGLSHVAFGLSGALDLGLRDGRCMFGWDEFEPDLMAHEFSQAYVGNLHTRRMEAGVWTGQVGGITLSPDATRVAYVAWHSSDESNSPGFVFEDDLDAGTHRLVCVFEGFGGSARVGYSGDGEWLLVSESRPVLIRRRDGAHLRLPGGMGAAWAPSYGPCHVMSMTGDDDPAIHLRVLDLSTGAFTDLGPLETVPDEPYVYLTGLDPHPQGGRALVSSPFGFMRPRELGLGLRSRVHVLDLDSRRLTAVTESTVPGLDHLQRDQSLPIWVADRRTGGTVQLSAELEAELTPSLAVSPTTEFLVDLVRLQLHRCVIDLEPSRPTQNAAKVRVEVLRSLRAILAADPALGTDLLAQIRDFVGPMSMQAVMSGMGDDDSRGMAGLGIGLQLLQEDRFDEYDWPQYAYRR